MSSPQLLRASLESLRDCPEKLIEIIVRQAAALEELQKQVKDLQDQIRDLNDRNNFLSSQVEALEKTAARQAAPFRIADKHRSADPQKAGPPPGASRNSSLDSRSRGSGDRCSFGELSGVRRTTEEPA